MPAPSRRQLLATLGTVGLGGCLSLDDGGGGESHLSEVRFANGNEEQSRTVDLRVTWDDEVVHDRAYELAAKQAGSEDASRAVAEQTWPDEPGQFTVSARVRGREWTSVDPANWDYPDCFTVFGSVENDRNVLLLWSDDPRYCEDTSDA